MEKIKGDQRALILSKHNYRYRISIKTSMNAANGHDSILAYSSVWTLLKDAISTLYVSDAI